MDSASFQFVLFGLVVALVSNFCRSRVWRSIVLMGASVVFLGLLAHNPIVFLLLAGFLLLGYAGLVLLKRECLSPCRSRSSSLPPSSWSSTTISNSAILIQVKMIPE